MNFKEQLSLYIESLDQDEYPYDAEVLSDHKGALVKMADKSKVATGVALLILNEQGELLMGKRKGSHGAGTYSVIGGWMEHGESFFDTAKREAKEEANLDIESVEVITAFNTFFPKEEVQSVTVLLLVHGHKGTPVAMEPDKLDGDWAWYNINPLPGDLALCFPSPLFKPWEDNYAELSANLRKILTQRSHITG